VLTRMTTTTWRIDSHTSFTRTVGSIHVCIYQTGLTPIEAACLRKCRDILCWPPILTSPSAIVTAVARASTQIDPRVRVKATQQ
jgi:hypothetical protein